jgi:hypothetical protein
VHAMPHTNRTQEVAFQHIQLMHANIYTYILFKVVRSDCKQFFSVLKKTELDYDTGIFMRLWNVKNVVSAALSTIIQL